MSVLRRSYLLVPILSLPLLVFGCAGDEPADAHRGTSTSVAPSTNASADPFAVPEVIDARYVERVTNELLRLLDDAARIALEEGAVTDEVRATLEAVYAEQTAPLMLEDLQNQAAAGFPGVKNPRGDTIASIEAVREATDACVIAEGQLDFAEVLVSPGGPVPMVVVLREGRDSNPTAWEIRAISPRDQFEPEVFGCNAS
jgi:hypothetical protein